MAAVTTGDDLVWPRAYELGQQSRAALSQAFKAMPDVFIVALTGDLALWFAIEFLNGRISPQYGAWLHDAIYRHSPLLLTVLSFGLAFLSLTVMASLAVAVHRFILLGERTTGLGPLAHAYAWRFVLWITIAVVVSIPTDFALPLAAWFFLNAIFVVLFVRLSLVFPGLAIGTQDEAPIERLVASWRRTRGRAWSIFVAYVVAIFPLVVCIYLPLFIVFEIPRVTDTVFVAVDMDRALEIVSLFGEVIATGCGAAVASCAWRAALPIEQSQPASN